MGFGDESLQPFDDGIDERGSANGLDGHGKLISSAGRGERTDVLHVTAGRRGVKWFSEFEMLDGRSAAVSRGADVEIRVANSSPPELKNTTRSIHACKCAD